MNNIPKVSEIENETIAEYPQSTCTMQAVKATTSLHIMLLCVLVVLIVGFPKLYWMQNISFPHLYIYEIDSQLI